MHLECELAKVKKKTEIVYKGFKDICLAGWVGACILFVCMRTLRQINVVNHKGFLFEAATAKKQE